VVNLPGVETHPRLDIREVAMRIVIHEGFDCGRVEEKHAR